MIEMEGRGFRDIRVGPFRVDRDAYKDESTPGTAIVGLVDVPLEKNARGCVMVPQVHVRYDYSGKKPNHRFETTNDMAAILLFDRLDYPLDGSKPNTDEVYDWLRAQDFYQRSRVQWDGGRAVQELTTVAALTAFEQWEAGHWAIMRGADEAVIPLAELEPHAAFQLKLYNALPIPAREVPLGDVLEFKAARRSELTALRHYLEALCLEVQREPDRPLVATHALERFDGALADYCRAVRGENRLNKALSSLTVKMNWNKLAAGAATGSIAAQAGLGLTAAACAGLGIAVSAISIESALGWRRSKALGPFEYIAQIERELY